MKKTPNSQEKISPNKAVPQNQSFWSRKKTTFGAAALVTLASAGFWYSNTPGSENDSPTSQVSQHQEILTPSVKERYVESLFNLTTDPSKPNIYILPQIHHLGGKLAKILDTTNDPEVIQCQKGIYRIIEDLYRHKGLQLVCNEGINYDNFSDVITPNKFKDQCNERREGNFEFARSIVEKGNDSVLESLLKLPSVGGEDYICMFYTDLYEVGFEREEIHDRAIELVEKQLESIAPAESDKLKAEEKVLNKQRSHDSLKYALQHSDNLYSQGKIKNKDVAIVIGEAHMDDFYEGIFTANLIARPYNLIVITPKGSEIARKAKEIIESRKSKYSSSSKAN